MSIFDEIYVAKCVERGNNIYCYYHTMDYFEAREDKQKFYPYPLLWSTLVHEYVICGGHVVYISSPQHVWVCFDKTNGNDHHLSGCVWLSRTRKDARALYNLHKKEPLFSDLAPPRKYYMV